MPFVHLNSEIALTEKVTRYIFDDSHFAATKSRVKPKAWEPAADNHTSVARIIDLSEADIWELGRQHVEPARQGRLILARADIMVQTIVGRNLRIIPAEPPPRHANVADWPIAKDAMLSIAQQLAAESKLEVRPK